MSETICAGMLVDLLPYEEVENHWGISEGSWNQLFSSNPHIVKTAYRYDITFIDSFFSFGKTAFIPHEETISAPIDDLI